MRRYFKREGGLTERIFQEFKAGNGSVRALARKYNIPFTTLRDRFRRMYGDDYRHRRGGEGTITCVLKEAIEALPEDENKESLWEWFHQNRNRIHDQAFADTISGRPRIYSEGKMKRDTYALCRLEFDLASSPFLADANERHQPQYVEDYEEFDELD